MNEKISKIFDFIKNNKTLVTVIIGFILVLEPTREVGWRYGNNKKINNLKNEISFYQEKIATSKETKDLKNNPKQLEKYARENFYMKKDNEDIFIIDED